MAHLDKKIAFIGGGHITDILLENLFSTKTLNANQCLITDPDPSRLDTMTEKYGVDTSANNEDAVTHGEYVFINVRPQNAEQVITELSGFSIPLEKIIVSIAAGITIGKLQSIGPMLPIIRALPNPGSQVGKGIAALAFNDYVTQTNKEEIRILFDSMGTSVILNETLINAMTSLSSPVSVFLFFQAMIEAGMKNGIDRETSTEIVYQTLTGSLEIWNQRRIPIDKLVDESCTPGGISVEIVAELAKAHFHKIITRAITRGTQKADSFGI